MVRDPTIIGSFANTLLIVYLVVFCRLHAACTFSTYICVVVVVLHSNSIAVNSWYRLDARVAVVLKHVGSSVVFSHADSTCTASTYHGPMTIVSKHRSLCIVVHPSHHNNQQNFVHFLSWSIYPTTVVSVHFVSWSHHNSQQTPFTLYRGPSIPS